MFRIFKSSGLKLFSVSLALVFFCTNVGFSYTPQATIWAERAGTRLNTKLALATSSTPPKPILPLHNEPFLAYEPHFTKLLGALKHSQGKIRPSAPPKNWNQSVVIHIQDIHQNAEAQTNISRSLENIFQTKQVGLLALEGTSASIHLDRFRNFSDQKTLQGVADYFLRQGEMAGSIHAALTSPAIPTIAGVDDTTHYEANVAAYRASYKQIESTKAKLSKLQNDLNIKKAKIFSKDLFAFNQRVEAYHRGDISLADHIGLLSAGRDGLPLHLELFKETIRLESKMDFKKVETERTKLIAQLVEKLNVDQTEALTLESQRFQQGQVTAADFYLFLQNLCNDVQLGLNRVPAFDAFVRYTLMADSIDMETVMSQMETLEDARYAEFQLTAQDTDLLQESKYLHLALKLIDYSLSSKEWKEYKAVIANEVKQSHEIASSYKALLAMTKPFEKFYEEASARDEAMAHNLLARMQAGKTNVAVLVTGGFHSDGISKKLADAGIATIKFVPKLTKVDSKMESGAVALGVFNQEKGLLDQLFEGTKLFLSVDPTAILPKVAAVTATNSRQGAELLRGTPVQIQSHEISGNNLTARIETIRSGETITSIQTRPVRTFRAWSFFRRMITSIEQGIQNLGSALLGISYMVPPGLEAKHMKKAVLQELFLHTDGIGFIAPVVHLNDIGLLTYLTNSNSHDPMRIETILEFIRKEKGHVNEGYVQAALWALESQGWIVRHLRDDGNFNFSVTSKGLKGIAQVSYYRPLFSFLPEIIRMNEVLFNYPSSKNGQPSPRDDPALAKLAALVELSKREWNLPSNINSQLRTEMIAQMDGLLAGPIMVELRDKLVQLRGDAFDQVTTATSFDINALGGISQSMDRTKKITETAVTGKPDAFRLVFDLMIQQGWVQKNADDTYNLTTAGVEEMRLAWSYGVPVSYAPLYNQWATLLYGKKPENVFKVDDDQNETHVNRLMNAKASGYTHKKSYMANEKMLQKLSEIFNQPLELQPKFVADMGCGDGALLGLIFDHIKNNTLRGRNLDSHPLLILGADYNHYSQAITKFNLDKAGVPNNAVMFGNINNPDEYAAKIKKKFGFDMSDGLHVRSMLDHNRPFIEPNMEAASQRQGHSLAVFVRPNGTFIPNSVVEQNLLEHYQKWAKHIGRHGLLVIELHTLAPKIAAQNIGKVMPTSYAMSHFPSAQYTIEAPIDIALAQEAGFLLDADKDVIYFPSKDLAMVTIKHLTRPQPQSNPAPSTWGISGKSALNTAFITLSALTPFLYISGSYIFSVYILFFSSLVYQFGLISSALEKAGYSKKRLIDPIEIAHSGVKILIKTAGILVRSLPIPSRARTYIQDLYEHKWKATINTWNRNPGLIPQFVNALEIDHRVPDGASRWLKLKYYFRHSMIVGVQYGDIAINKKAMALLPTWVQYWFLRHAQNLLWYKLAIRRQTAAPESPTKWAYISESIGNIIESLVVTLWDFIPFTGAGNVTHLASQHYRKMIRPYVPETPLIEIPELKEELGIRVWAKMENMHRSKAYKYRMFGQIFGWFRMMTPYMRRQIQEILVASTGNQAIAVGMATQQVKNIFPRELGHLKARAYVGVNITEGKAQKLERLGMGMTKTDLETGKPNTNYGEANAAAQKEADRRTDALLTQHGSVNVMTAYSTLAEDLDGQLTAAQSERLPTAVFIPYGSGGFFGGVKNALQKVQRLRAMALLYREYKPYAVQTTRVSSGALSRGLKRPIRERSLFAANADGIGVTEPDATAQTELRMNDETVVLDDLQIIAARVILKNLMDRDDIETTSATTFAALLVSHERLKAKDRTKQAVLVISGGNTTNRVPNNPNPTAEETRNHRILRLYELLTAKPYPDLPPHIPTAWVPLAKKVLQKYSADQTVPVELRAKINSLLELTTPANAVYLGLLAKKPNPTANELARYAHIGKTATAFEVGAMLFSAGVLGFGATAIISAAMFVYHVVALGKIGKSPYVGRSFAKNALFHLAVFSGYTLLGYFGSYHSTTVFALSSLVIGAFHLTWDLRYFNRLPKATNLSVNQAGPIVRTVELSQSKNIDRVLLPVLTELTQKPELKVVFVVAPKNTDESVTSIAVATVKAMAGQRVPRERVTFNLAGELSLESVLADAHSGQPNQYANGLWKTVFAQQSARIELIKTTDRWTPMSGSLRVGNWLNVQIDHVLQVLFNMDDATISLDTVIQSALTAMKAA